MDQKTALFEHLVESFCQFYAFTIGFYEILILKNDLTPTPFETMLRKLVNWGIPIIRVFVFQSLWVIELWRLGCSVYGYGHKCWPISAIQTRFLHMNWYMVQHKREPA